MVARLLFVVTLATLLGVDRPAAARAIVSSKSAVSVGAGVSDFVARTFRAPTDVGATWDARLTIGTSAWLAFELAYVGTWNRFSTRGDSPSLVQHGLDGDLRLNLWRLPVQPYLFVGVGYNSLRLAHREEAPQYVVGFRGDDHQLTLPAGVGLTAAIGRHALLDARFTYRAVFLDELVANGARGDQWQLSARLGYQF